MADKTLEELRAELNAAIAERQSVTARASSIPTRREQAAKALHKAKTAQARGGPASAVEEARATLHALRDEEELAPYEVDAAVERVLEVEIRVADAEFSESTKEAEEVMAAVLEIRPRRERLQREEGAKMAEFSAAEGRADRALRRGRDAAVRLQGFHAERQTRKEQTLVDAGVQPRPRQQRRGEVVFDTLR